MNKPTVLRNSAEPEVVIGIALKIYYNQNDWVSNAVFLDELDKEYDAAGKARESRSGGQMIAKYKPSLYYGLIDCRPEDDCKKINEYGKRYYEAYLSNNQDEMVDCLLHAISVKTFGRNNAAVPSSDSDIEPPKVFLVASLLLKGLTRYEYAYILEQLSNGREFQVVLVDVMVSRQLGKDVKLSEYAKNNYCDDKGIKFLADAGLFEDGKAMRVIKEKYVLKYATLLQNMSIFNSSVHESDFHNEPNDSSFEEPNQIIYFGAPGTGKSFRVEQITENYKDDVIRTTFHPDSDYSTFVGCYKPSMESIPQTYTIEGKEKPIIGKDGEQVAKEEIVYSFVPQAFTQAYTKAWLNQGKPIFLVIEELNRGNCAQIFGDIFQLLDRNEDNESAYSIIPDHDLQQHLAEEFKNAEGIPSDIKEAKAMRLPSNLYIWATMNTSDQSLFPIDSAFKRRWIWKYIPIADAEKGYKIKVGGHQYDWWAFVEKVNGEIELATKSEDKKLGYFFAKADNGIIAADTFVSKVVFYLWNDVFKDSFDKTIFKNDLTFHKFFEPDGEPKLEVIDQFMHDLELKADGEE